MRNQIILRSTAWILACQLVGSFSWAAVSFSRVDAGDIGVDALHCESLAWGDYDGDGWVDLFAGFNTFKTRSEPYRLYHNNGDGTFTRVLDGGIADDPETSYSFGPTWADFDNDGDLDLYVAECENLMAASEDRLYLNNGDGTFVRGGLDWIDIDFTVDAVWLDANRDGLLDLALTGYYTVSLFLQTPDGSMEERLIADIPDKFFSTMNWSDFDNDNDLDLFISGGDNLYLNDGNANFTPNPLQLTSAVTGLALGDYDNDGDLDLAKGHFKGENLELYTNNGDGTLSPSGVDITAPGDRGYRPCSWADYDNDGYLDLFIPSSSHEGLIVNNWTLDDPNLLYRNNGDGTFTLVTEGPLVNDMGMSYAAGWADYDNDGDLDVVLSDGQNMANQGAQLPAVPVALYRNDGGNDNNWLNLTLEGVVSNRSAIGAKVFAQATVNGVAMQQLREVGSGQGGYSQCDTRVHFGLGDAVAIDRLRIEWPSGGVQIIDNVDANQFLEVEEYTWGGLPVVMTDEGNFVHTRTALGWICVAPQGWVYCYKMEGWICIPEEFVTEFGVWLYAPRYW